MKSVTRIRETANLQHIGMVALASIAFTLVCATASAQPAADDIRARVKQGQKVSITDANGRELNGRISGLTADGVSLEERTSRVVVPYSDIVRIDRPRDTLANGALIGFGVGAALGLALTAAEDQKACDPTSWWGCSEPSAAGYAAGTLVLAGLGSAIGVGVDALIRRARSIYRRGEGARLTVAPALSTRMRGAVVTVSW